MWNLLSRGWASITAEELLGVAKVGGMGETQEEAQEADRCAPDLVRTWKGWERPRPGRR